ncbi:MAG TPA: LysE family transporter [Stellaceae bacterium]|nr:LysE family transporter [Stellaceae bacterium]
MLIVTLLKGIAVGIVIALPVGPVGLLCVRRTLFGGMRFGLVSGLGAACADTVFGIVAGFGLTVVRDWILGFQDWLGAAGGVYLVWTGAHVLLVRAAPEPEPEPLGGEALAGAFASTFALTITNPITILAFAAIFAKFGIAPNATSIDVAVLVAGVFAGSALWWLGITIGIAWVRRRARGVRLGWLNRLSGAVLSLSGLALLAAAWLGFAGIRR